ncbi:MAG: hypothetical protein M1837_002360 [Sclerophora amabilis]|nr:MAG: hypothetical protein M1837_002360 [Sclerophora amabilis]
MPNVSGETARGLEKICERDLQKDDRPVPASKKRRIGDACSARRIAPSFTAINIADHDHSDAIFPVDEAPASDDERRVERQELTQPDTSHGASNVSASDTKTHSGITRQEILQKARSAVYPRLRSTKAKAAKIFSSPWTIPYLKTCEQSDTASGSTADESDFQRVTRGTTESTPENPSSQTNEGFSVCNYAPRSSQETPLQQILAISTTSTTDVVKMDRSSMDNDDPQPTACSADFSDATSGNVELKNPPHCLGPDGDDVGRVDEIGPSLEDYIRGPCIEDMDGCIETYSAEADSVSPALMDEPDGHPHKDPSFWSHYDEDPDWEGTADIVLEDNRSITKPPESLERHVEFCNAEQNFNCLNYGGNMLTHSLDESMIYPGKHAEDAPDDPLHGPRDEQGVTSDKFADELHTDIEEMEGGILMDAKELEDELLMGVDEFDEDSIGSEELESIFFLPQRPDVSEESLEESPHPPSTQTELNDGISDADLMNLAEILPEATGDQPYSKIDKISEENGQVNEGMAMDLVHSGNSQPKPRTCFSSSYPAQALEQRTNTYHDCASPLGSPLGRSSIPSPVPVRGPVVPGISAHPCLRTYFRIFEALQEGTKAHHDNYPVIIELYARVANSQREADCSRQHFQFKDLFHERPPFVNGTQSAWEGKGFKGLWEEDTAGFLDDQKRDRMARVVGKIERRPEDSVGWRINVLSIWEATWEDIEWARGIVRS